MRRQILEHEGGEESQPPSFEAIYRTHAQRVFHWASRYAAGDVVVAEDLTHDVFLRLFECLPELDSEDIGAWLYRVTAHLAISRLRTRRTWVTKVLGALKNAGRTQRLEPELEAREEAGHALAALDALPARERTVACMRFLDEKSQHEIAEALELSEGYVSKLLARAVERLRESTFEGSDEDG